MKRNDPEQHSRWNELLWADDPLMVIDPDHLGMVFSEIEALLYASVTFDFDPIPKIRSYFEGVTFEICKIRPADAKGEMQPWEIERDFDEFALAASLQDYVIPFWDDRFLYVRLGKENASKKILYWKRAGDEPTEGFEHMENINGFPLEDIRRDGGNYDLRLMEWRDDGGLAINEPKLITL